MTTIFQIKVKPPHTLCVQLLKNTLTPHDIERGLKMLDVYAAQQKQYHIILDCAILNMSTSLIYFHTFLQSVYQKDGNWVLSCTVIINARYFLFKPIIESAVANVIRSNKVFQIKMKD
jgi:hypothetical protein